MSAPGQHRLYRSEKFVDRVRAELHALNWQTERLDRAHHDILRDFYTPYRWLPDIVARRGDRAMWIDPKSGRTDTDFYDIEIDALAAYLAIEKPLGMPAFVAFDYPEIRIAHAPIVYANKFKRGVFMGNGSGTPFWLIAKGTMEYQTIPEIFGPKDQHFFREAWKHARS